MIWRLDVDPGGVPGAHRSGLVPPAKLEQARAQLEPGPAEAVSLRLAKQLIGQGLLTADQGRKLLERLTVELKTGCRTMAFSRGELQREGLFGKDLRKPV